MRGGVRACVRACMRGGICMHARGVCVAACLHICVCICMHAHGVCVAACLLWCLLAWVHVAAHLLVCVCSCAHDCGGIAAMALARSRPVWSVRGPHRLPASSGDCPSGGKTLFSPPSVMRAQLERGEPGHGEAEMEDCGVPAPAGLVAASSGLRQAAPEVVVRRSCSMAGC